MNKLFLPLILNLATFTVMHSMDRLLLVSYVPGAFPILPAAPAENAGAVLTAQEKEYLTTLVESSTREHNAQQYKERYRAAVLNCHFKLKDGSEFHYNENDSIIIDHAMRLHCVDAFNHATKIISKDTLLGIIIGAGESPESTSSLIQVLLQAVPTDTTVLTRDGFVDIVVQQCQLQNKYGYKYVLACFQAIYDDSLEVNSLLRIMLYSFAKCHITLTTNERIIMLNLLLAFKTNACGEGIQQSSHFLAMVHLARAIKLADLYRQNPRKALHAATLVCHHAGAYKGKPEDFIPLDVSVFQAAGKNYCKMLTSVSEHTAIFRIAPSIMSFIPFLACLKDFKEGVAGEYVLDAAGDMSISASYDTSTIAAYIDLLYLMYHFSLAHPHELWSSNNEKLISQMVEYLKEISSIMTLDIYQLIHLAHKWHIPAIAHATARFVDKLQNCDEIRTFAEHLNPEYIELLKENKRNGLFTASCILKQLAKGESKSSFLSSPQLFRTAPTKEMQKFKMEFAHTVCDQLKRSRAELKDIEALRCLPLSTVASFLHQPCNKEKAAFIFDVWMKWNKLGLKDLFETNALEAYQRATDLYRLYYERHLDEVEGKDTKFYLSNKDGSYSIQLSFDEIMHMAEHRSFHNRILEDRLLEANYEPLTLVIFKEMISWWSICHKLWDDAIVPTPSNEPIIIPMFEMILYEYSEKHMINVFQLLELSLHFDMQMLTYAIAAFVRDSENSSLLNAFIAHLQPRHCEILMTSTQVRPFIVQCILQKSAVISNSEFRRHGEQYVTYVREALAQALCQEPSLINFFKNSLVWQRLQTALDQEAALVTRKTIGKMPQVSTARKFFINDHMIITPDLYYFNPDCFDPATGKAERLEGIPHHIQKIVDEKNTRFFILDESHSALVHDGTLYINGLRDGLYNETGHYDIGPGIQSLKLIGDDTFLVGTREGLRLINAKKGTVIQQLAQGGSYSASKCGDYIVSIMHSSQMPPNEVMNVWEKSWGSYRCIATISLPLTFSHLDDNQAIACDMYKDQLFSAWKGRNICCYSIKNSQELITLAHPEQQGGFKQCTFIKVIGSYLVAHYNLEDTRLHTLCIWDLEEKKVLSTFALTSPLESCIALSNGTGFRIILQDGTVQVYVIHKKQSLEEHITHLNNAPSTHATAAAAAASGT